MSCFDAMPEQDETLAPLPVVQVAAAVLIDADGRVLIAQRPEGKAFAGLWEFPGGKLETGETPEQTLVRELKEELDIDTRQSCLAPISFVSHRYDAAHLLMLVYACRTWKGFVRPMEHTALAWVDVRKLREYPMPAADLPLIPVLHDLLVAA